jgi:hypothetical protein
VLNALARPAARLVECGQSDPGVLLPVGFCVVQLLATGLVIGIGLLLA